LAEQTPFGLGMGEYEPITITFAPITAGDFTAELLIVCAQQDTHKVSITGTGHQPPLAAPRNLIGSYDFDEHETLLTWEAPETSSGSRSVRRGRTGVTLLGYRVYRGDNVIAELVVEETYTDTSMLFGAVYNYHVTAIYVEGESAPSNIVSVRVLDPSVLNIVVSTFTANYTEDSTVNITWITASETNLTGFQIHKGSSNDVGESARHGVRISATNTSENATYNFVDSEIQPGNSYFYWLEILVNDGTSYFHEPVFVEIPVEHIEIYPLVTTVSNAYPNPMRVGSFANFDVAVKERELATLKIFNIKGQLVKEFNDIQQGSHKLEWNGRDLHNREVSSGVYFYRLISPSTNEVKRMVIIR
jgi:hypothetical protein